MCSASGYGHFSASSLNPMMFNKLWMFSLDLDDWMIGWFTNHYMSSVKEFFQWFANIEGWSEFFRLISPDRPYLVCTNHTLSSIWPDGSGFSCCSCVRIANFPPPEKRFSRQTHTDRWKFHHDYKFDTSLAGGFNFFYLYPSLRRIISNLMAIIFNIPQQKGYTSVYFEKKTTHPLDFLPGWGLCHTSCFLASHAGRLPVVFPLTGWCPPIWLRARESFIAPAGGGFRWVEVGELCEQ